jgi:multiple sugar transport system ATP-binding protein
MASVSFDHVTKRFGDEVVAVDDFTLTVDDGEFLILVGPSGCGKTTLLRMAAGLEEVTSGEIRIGERLVTDAAPSERDIAMVFQNYALYPHMSVHDNLAFPLRQKKVKNELVKLRVTEVARLLGIDELLDRKPRALSGGQRQRVAIGRALVREPHCFLMDEPLSNLDAKLRVQMRAELISLHNRLGITTVYVTHDQTEAMTLGDRVVVLNKGVVQQIDTPENLYRNPVNTFVAGFIGSPAMNFLDGTIAGGHVRLGAHSFELPERLRSILTGSDGPVVVGLRPEDFILKGGRPDAISAQVEISERLGPEVLVHLRVDGIRVASPGERAAKDEDPAKLQDLIVARFGPDFSARTGETVGLSVVRERLQLFDVESGRSLCAAHG